MIDTLVYPVATTFVPFGSPVLVTGGSAMVATPEEANGESLPPSFAGDAVGYQIGQTMRVRTINRAIGDQPSGATEESQ